ncbi:hypothetical protein OAA83_03425, partial [Candidatus Marinimicrobia bacterium]|nr:hypothetical protein [Candidatus Neomarinimicrobiota bacterium]
MQNKPSQNFLIWDSKDLPPKEKKILLWKGYSESKNQYSILKYLEENSNELRLEYLNYINDLSQVQIKNKKVVEHLKIDKNHSLWWMSLLAEKSPAKSKTPLNCLRLLATNLFFINYKPQSIEFVSNCKITAESLSNLCSNLNIDFQWKKSKIHTSSLSFKNSWKKVPHVIKAIYFILIETSQKWSLKKSKQNNWFDNKNTFFIFSYFFALDKKDLKNNKFYSKQWE